MASGSAAPMQCWPRASSTTASSPSLKRSRRCATPAWKYDNECAGEYANPMSDNWLNKVNWSDDGLIPVIAQEVGTNKILTLAWMNRDALRLTAEKGEAVYWSRSRKKLWRKGEESGHVQKV